MNKIISQNTKKDKKVKGQVEQKVKIAINATQIFKIWVKLSVKTKRKIGSDS